MSSNSPKSPEMVALLQQRMMFFSQAGQCIIEYQGVEDHLENVFAAALSGPKNRADAIFAIARGLEAKLSLIDASLLNADAAYRTRWQELKRRVTQAAASRNQIAHSRPVSTSDPIFVEVSNDPEKPGKAWGGGNPRVEIWKKMKNGDAKWTSQDLREEFLRNKRLYTHVLVFEMDLRGAPVPDHLRNA
ncbi:hypothetical protein [Lichenibacterium dinghuense]|uniref:hypothetical protein n=1 Tax=Lichenibacterium dinghuense TaxID=2895977 RepID=UPI001F213A60|nr:hypothetical protein [Lichenibacterium sp. 6Y81]